MMGPLAAPLIEVSADADVSEHLYQRALQFVRCGGRVTLTEWNSMSAPERVAMETAYATHIAGTVFPSSDVDAAADDAVIAAMDAAQGAAQP